MRVVRGFTALGLGLRSPAVTIGNFDGVHRGHQRVMRAATDVARQRGATSVVCTFDPHTLKVLRPQEAPRLLQTLDQRLAAIESTGVDLAVVIPFDREIAATGRRRFVDDFLCGELKVGSLHVSKGFSFGRGRSGKTEYLEERAAELGFTVDRVDAARATDEDVSSSRIREAVAAGHVDLAAAMLGRPYGLSGTVVHGSGRGGDLGAPTANIAPRNECRPGCGVYAGIFRSAGLEVGAVMNVGVRPTFNDDHDVRYEAHLLDYSGDLYEADVELDFVARIRDERRFDSPGALATQIRADAEAARRLVAAPAGA